MTESGKRQPYEPPAVERIRFGPTELAAGSCKKTPAGPLYPKACKDNGKIGPTLGS